MSRRALVPSRSPLFLFSLLAACAVPAAAAADARVSESYGKLPLHFEENQGQTHKDVRFLARGPGYGLYLTAGEAVLVLSTPNNPQPQAKPVALRMSLVGARSKPLVSGLEELPGKANYFIGKDPSQWRTNVPAYAKVHYREVYPGIDLVYYGNQRQLEYDFVVAPGADPKKIVLGFKGAQKLGIDTEGDLILQLAGSDVRLKKPVIYQEIDGSRTDIKGGYLLNGANRIGFEVAAYDKSRPLIIDPVVLSYSTYLGGSGGEAARGIAVDASRNAYVTGVTDSTNFPTTAGAFQSTRESTTSTTFVTKLNTTGSALVYSTYLGGANALAIAVDAEGNAYVTGNAWPDLPTTPGVFQPLFGGYIDSFVTKLNPAGSALVYSTYLGGADGEGGDGIAVDAGGHAYVTGGTRSTNFPTTPGAFQPLFDGGGGDMEGFVTKLNPAGSALVYSTYLGGSPAGIAVDAAGDAYVAGYTWRLDLATTPGAFQPFFGGGVDAFVTRLSATGSELVYSTYLGGNGADYGFHIAVDAAGNAYMTGRAGSGNFPTTPGAFQPLIGGNYDVFVTKLNPAGSALVYSTYLGGSDWDSGEGIAVDAAGNAYVTGATSSANFPATTGAFQASLAAGTCSNGYRAFPCADAFVTKLDPTGSTLVYSTFLGGSGSDSGAGIAVDPNGNAYVTGHTASLDIPTTAGAFQPSYQGGADAFVAKITDETPTTSSTPFTGTPFAIPRSFEAEDFDLGGEGVAYHDNVPGNAGGQYRTGEDVDIIVSSDSAGGGYVVNNFETGEWLAYTINVASSAQYDIELRASSGFSNSAFHVEIDGVNVTGSVLVPNTGSWSAFQWVGRKGVSLTAGQHVLKIVTDQQYFDLNSIRVAATPTSPAPSRPPIAVPGSFEAEDFDLGGEGVGYHDNVPGSAGGQYRLSEDVDIIVSSDFAGGSYVVNNFETGEWLAYTINVPASGDYDIELRASTSLDFRDAAYHVEIDGVNQTGTIRLPVTGGWNRFEWVGKRTLSLAAGTRVLKIVADRQYFNLNSIRITPSTPKPTPTPFTLEAEDFDRGGEGVGYHDNVPGNAGGQYRLSEDVDIIVSTDPEGGGYVVNDFETGEWLAYTINVPASGSYRIELRAATTWGSGYPGPVYPAYHIEIDGVNQTGTIAMGDTGGLNSFMWISTTTVSLTEGTRILKIVSDQQYFNLNQIRVTLSP